MDAKENNFAYLFVAMIVLVIGMPIARDLTGIDVPVLQAVLQTFVLVIGTGSMRADPVIFRACVALVALGVSLQLLHLMYRMPVLEISAMSCVFVYLLVMIAIAMQQVVTVQAINRNRIVGSVCVYLLLGVLWAILYRLLFLIAPASFRGLNGSEVDLEAFTYFSFVTLTTLGYGDIVPVSGMARSLVILETMAGQLYIAILVAGLVGAYIAQRVEQRD
ncbi:MAG: potassium channel family protein [Pseudomonadota bacterium]